MKKTIFTLFMIGLMLVGSSAMSMNVNNCEDNLNVGAGNNNDKPDFIIKTFDWVKCRCPYGYIIHIRISNIGAEIEDISVKVKVTLDSDENTISINYIEGVGPSTLYATHLEIDFYKSTHVVTAEVDPPYEGHPNGDIIESNEDNNIMIKSFTKNTKLQGLSFQNLLDLFPNSFQVLMY